MIGLIRQGYNVVIFLKHCNRKRTGAAVVLQQTLAPCYTLTLTARRFFGPVMTSFDADLRSFPYDAQTDKHLLTRKLFKAASTPRAARV